MTVSLFLDSADRAAAEPLMATGLFAGVTTNPTILARAGLGQHDLPTVIGWAVAAGAERVFVQVVGREVQALVDNGRRLRDLGPSVVVKVPASREGCAAGRVLTAEGVEVLLTAVHHPAQALLATAVGASWIAPYVGRADDRGRDGTACALMLHRALAGSGTRVLAASLRTLDQVGRLAAEGVADVTLGVALADALLADELTLVAVEEFEVAHAATAESG